VPILKQNCETIPSMIESLTEYVGYNTSKDILCIMNKMEFEEIVHFKQSLEDILMFIISEQVVH
jgi:hypothetical protein